MDWIKHIVRLLVAFLLQVLLVGHLQFFGICQPFVYIVFLLMMPIRMPRWGDMLIGAILGLIVDIFCNSIGIHMASCVMLCFLRRIIIENIVMDYDRLTGEISGRSIGPENYIKYVVALVLIHHSMVFILSAWSFAHLWLTALTILVSSMLSIAMILGYDYARK